MKHRWLVLVSLVLCFCVLSPAALGLTKESVEAAEQLKTLGLFQGTENGYELERIPTRQEALTMLVRLLGKEEEAFAGQWVQPFEDVSAWAEPYVGYGYQHNLAKGFSATEFGGEEPITASQYLTFLLRALGYDSDLDFSADTPYALAKMIGLPAENRWQNQAFSRGDMVLLSRDVLRIGRKTDGMYLIKALYQEGVVDQAALQSLSWGYLLTQPSLRQQSSFFIGDKLVSLRMTETELIRLFGQPAEKMFSIQGYTWYAYDAEDYSDFFLVGVKGNRVVSLYGNSYGFRYCDTGLDDDRTGSQYNAGLGGFYIRYYNDSGNDNRIHAIGLQLDNEEAPTYDPDALLGEARTCFHVTNGFRVANGLDPLKWDEDAARVAKNYSASMAYNQFFSHTGTDGSSVGKRLTDGGIPWQLCGENIAAGYYGIAAVQDGWVNSPGHRGNLLQDRYQYVGIGLHHVNTGSYRVYWTQNFYERYEVGANVSEAIL